ncbi:MAG: hypothetical protein QQN46_08670 [Nitrosopumilus sp.]
MTKRNSIISDIYSVDSIECLRSIQLAVNQRRSELESRGALNFKIGDSVKFTSRRHGGIQVGTVKKINRKTIAVVVGNVIWRVTPSLLSPLHKSAAA